MSDTKTRQSTLQALKAYLRPKPLIMLSLGYATGIPFLLIGDTLNAWLRVEGVSLSVIGFFILVSFAYTLKFMWAPLVDRINIPVLTNRLGHRRSWMIVLQILMALGLLAVAFTDPKTQLIQMALFATLTGIFGATHDIVLDAYRIEMVGTTEEMGVVTAAYQWGYRMAFIVSGFVPLLLATRVGWSVAYAVMALMLLIGWATVWIAPKGPPHVPLAIHTEGMPVRRLAETAEWLGRVLLIAAAAVIAGSGLTGNADVINGILGAFHVGANVQAAFKATFTSKTTGWLLQIPFVVGGLGLMFFSCLPLPWATRPGAYAKGAFVEPLADFFRRYDKWAFFIFGLICIYRISEFTLNLANAYYIDLGFSLDRVGEMRKGYGALMTMVGVVISGWTIARLGIRKALIVGAVAGPLSHVGFMILACAGHSLWALALALAMDNIAASIQGTVLIVYMSSLVAAPYTAAQYALLSSIYAILGKLVASQSGRIVETSAKAADAGGFSSLFKGLMGHLTPDAYVKAAKGLGVSVPAMGAGYFSFFAYTIVVSLGGIVMAVWLYYRYKPSTAELAAEAEKAEA
jgi:PAT family beta-lactamase induction signal transducer AmpG